jgi:hypothetical protein
MGPTLVPPSRAANSLTASGIDKPTNLTSTGRHITNKIHQKTPEMLRAVTCLLSCIKFIHFNSFLGPCYIRLEIQLCTCPSVRCSHLRAEVPFWKQSKVLTAVVIKSSIFRDIIPCSPLKINQRFGGTCRFNLQYRRISQARNQHEVGSKHRWFLAWVTLQMKATCSSETSIVFQCTTWRYIPEDRHFETWRLEFLSPLQVI